MYAGAAEAVGKREAMDTKQVVMEFDMGTWSEIIHVSCILCEAEGKEDRGGDSKDFVHPIL